MNDFQNVYQTLNDNFKTGLRQWQDAIQAWNGFVTDAGQTQIETLFALREQNVNLWAEANKRAGDLASRERKLAAETAELWQKQVKANADLATQLAQSTNETVQAFSAETGRAVQRQAQVAQSQVNELIHQAADAVAAVAETPVNGARSRVVKN